MKKGDTIIEVIFAISVFAMVAVTSIVLMNRGLATTQSSLELTLARNEIDSQASALRFMHAANSTDWTTVTSKAIIGEVPPLSLGTSETCQTLLDKSKDNNFIISPRDLVIGDKNRIELATVYPRIYYNHTDAETNIIDSNIGSWKSQGIWVIATKNSSDSGLEYYDFHIRACWNEAGRSVPSTIGTIVRLYSPGGQGI